MTGGSLPGRALGVLRQDGPVGLAERVIRTASRRLSLGDPLLLRSEDVVDPIRLRPAPTGPRRPRGTPLTIGWVITAPARNSGGHTTLFRFVEALERAGHRCVLHVYDPGGGPVSRYAPSIRAWWPRMRAEIRTVDEGLPSLDAYVATSWETAHVLARRADVTGHRFYLAQDYEPYFYARGSAHQLAEDTYRFGYHVITVGHMVADELRERFGIEAAVAEFGCDTTVYGGCGGDGPANGVVFYCRPATARRGSELGILALERFSRLRPEVPIRTFGAPVRRLPFPAEVHAALSPARIAELYRRSSAGLALSFTNISLTAYELLAAGVVPVVNDWRGSRADLANPHVEWARPTPDDLADALSRAHDRRAGLPPAQIGASVAGMSWRPAEETVRTAVERVCAGEAVTSSRGREKNP